jgi:hypothetical protein
MPHPAGTAAADDSPTLHAAIGPAEQIRAARDEIETGRRTPQSIAAAMKEAGVFGIAMPRAWGGPELDPLIQIRVIEALAMADGSLGWYAMIGCNGGYVSAFLDQNVVPRVARGDLSSPELHERDYSGEPVRLAGTLRGLTTGIPIQGTRVLMPSAGGAAEHAKLGAMRVVELDAIAGRREGSSKFELRVVGQQRARDNGRVGRTLVLHDHACGRAHDVRRRLAENAPARLGDLGDVDPRIHFRENHQRNRVIGIERHAELSEQLGKTAAQLDFRLARKIPACDG